MLYTLLIILGFIILYQIIKFKFTEYKYTEVVVLKNEMSSEWVDGTNKPFNLIGNIKDLPGDKISIIQVDKYVFNKLIKTKFEISQKFTSDF